MKYKIIFLVCITVFPLLVETVAAEPVMITASSKVTKVEFDGKWTTETEWKPTSLNTINDPYTIIRSAHYENFVYLMIDVLHDTSVEVHSDRAMVCFDTDNNKSKIPDEHDYCFMATVGSSNGITLQGGSSIINKSYFKRIANHGEFIAIGAMSDEVDRYDKIPHVSYEFKIPTEMIGRSNVYGFLVYIYDANTNSVQTWPSDIQINERLNIPSPSNWGEMISPDNSLPEFHWPFLALFPAFMLIIFFARKLEF